MAVTSFIPELWAARLQDALEKEHVATAFVNTNYEGEIKKMGDTVHINSIGDITINDYLKNTDINDPEELTTDATQLVIDKSKYFNFQVDDIDAVQAAGELIDPATKNAAIGLADVVDTDIFTEISGAVTAAKDLAYDKEQKKIVPLAVTSANVYEAIVKMRNAMRKAHIPKGTWKLAVPTEITGLLLMDDRFVKATDAANERLENGFVGKVAGFDVYETESLPINSDDSVRLIGTYNGATSFAEQLVELEAYRPEKRFADAVKGLDVYGVKCTRPDAVVGMTVSF